MAAFNKINVFVQNLANGVHNLASDAPYVALTNSTPVATNTILANITQIANGNGYTTGGSAATVTSSTQTSGTEKWLVQSVTFTASGAFGPFRYAVLYDSTPVSPVNPLIAWWDFGSAVTLASGDTFTVAFDQTNGVLQIT